jgi:hypothetical protein
MMNSYETTATVEDNGQVRVAGVPFESGTQVQVTISPKPAGSIETRADDDDDQAWATARRRIGELLATARGFRNSPRIPREELYERGRLP